MARTSLGHLELLVAVAEAGSIGGAARALSVAQPTVSAQLSQLERRMGVVLVRRTRRGSPLTPTGEAVTGWARDVLTASDRFEQALAALRGTHAARLRISASMTIAEYLVPGWLATFRALNPDVVAAVRVGNSEQVGLDVLAGIADVGFVEGMPAPDGLVERVVADDRLIVVASARHQLAASPGPIEVGELVRCRLVLREPGSGTREIFERAMAERGVALSPALEFGSTSAIKSALEDPDLVGVVSALAVESEIARGDLSVIEVADLDLHRTLRAVWPAGRRLVPPASDFVLNAGRS